MPRDMAAHLTRNYGTRALQVCARRRAASRTAARWSTSPAPRASPPPPQIAELVRNGYVDRAASLPPRRLVDKYPFLEAEVVFAVKQEYALSVVDVLARRTRLAFLDSEAAVAVVPRVVQLMGELLKWSKERREAEKAKALEFLETMRNQAKRRGA